MKIRQRIDQLAAAHGSMRKLGKALGIDHAYLHRLRTGEKRNPSDAVLEKLGLVLMDIEPEYMMRR